MGTDRASASALSQLRTTSRAAALTSSSGGGCCCCCGGPAAGGGAATVAVAVRDSSTRKFNGGTQDPPSDSGSGSGSGSLPIVFSDAAAAKSGNGRSAPLRLSSAALSSERRMFRYFFRLGPSAPLRSTCSRISYVKRHGSFLVRSPLRFSLCLSRACLGKAIAFIENRSDKDVFLSHLYIKTNILPRQARDKHREKSFLSRGCCRKLNAEGVFHLVCMRQVSLG